MTNHNLTFKHKFEKTKDIFNLHKKDKNPYKIMAQKICEFSSYNDLKKYLDKFQEKNITDFDVYGFPVVPIYISFVFIGVFKYFLFKLVPFNSLNDLLIHTLIVIVFSFILISFMRFIFFRRKYKMLEDLIEDLILEHDIYDVNYNLLKERDLNTTDEIVDYKKLLNNELLINKYANNWDNLSEYLSHYFTFLWIIFCFFLVSKIFNSKFDLVFFLVFAIFVFILLPFALYNSMDEKRKFQFLKFFKFIK